MASDREQMFLEMTREFPDSPMGFFSLGRMYLDEKRWAESVKALAEAVRLDPNYSAAWVALVMRRSVWDSATTRGRPGSARSRRRTRAAI